MPPNECPKESDLLRLNRLFRTVSEINKITPGSLSELQYIENICRIATNTGGFLIAWVGLLHADRTLRAVAVAGKAKDYVEGLALSADPALPEGNGPTGRALRTRSPVITNDFLTNPMTHLWHERASHYGIACSAALPLYVGEDVVGIFSGYGGEDHQLGDVEVALLTHLSADIAFGLQSIAHAATLAKSARALESTVERLNAIELITRAGSFQISLPSRETWLSGGAAAVLGTSSMGMVGGDALMLAIAPEARPIFLAAVDECAGSGTQLDIDLPLSRGSAETVWIRLFGVAAPSESGEASISGTVQDITARKAADEDLMVAVDRERARLQAEIHDDLGQTLTGMSMMISAARKQGIRSAVPACVLESLADALTQALSACRQIAHGAPGNAIGPLDEALQALADFTGRSGVSCRFDNHSNYAPPLSPEQALDLYRIAQEAVTNALKHSGCSEIVIALIEHGDFLDLSITDNGCGLVRRTSGEWSGIGIQNMKVRAARAGGMFAVLRGPKGGTSVKTLIPISRPRRTGGWPRRELTESH
jgi:signal transduction histidine kinase